MDSCIHGVAGMVELSPTSLPRTALGASKSEIGRVARCIASILSEHDLKSIHVIDRSRRTKAAALRTL